MRLDQRRHPGNEVGRQEIALVKEIHIVTGSVAPSLVARGPWPGMRALGDGRCVVVRVPGQASLRAVRAAIFHDDDLVKPYRLVKQGLRRFVDVMRGVVDEDDH